MKLITFNLRLGHIAAFTSVLVSLSAVLYAQKPAETKKPDQKTVHEKTLPRKGYVLSPGEGIPIPNLGKESFIKMSGDNTETRVALHESLHPAGYSPGLHIHTKEDEYFYLLEGSYEFYIDGQWHTAGPGSFVFIPKGIKHGFRTGSDGGRALVIFSPAGMEKFFQEFSKAQQEGKQIKDFFEPLAKKYGLEYLGQLPEKK